METKYLFGTLFILLLFLLPTISAEMIYQESSEVQLKIPCINNGTLCSGSANCDITILYPNSTTHVSRDAMTNEAGFFSYDLSASETTPIGTYTSTVNCSDGSFNGYSTFDYEITVNGKEKPSGIVIVVFGTFFLAIIASLTFLFMYTIGKFADKDFDMWDLIFNMSAYFVIIAVFFLSQEYLGNAKINDILTYAIVTTGITNMLFPFIVFIISITIWKWQEAENWF